MRPHAAFHLYYPAECLTIPQASHHSQTHFTDEETSSARLQSEKAMEAHLHLVYLPVKQNPPICFPT